MSVGLAETGKIDHWLAHREEQLFVRSTLGLNRLCELNGLVTVFGKATQANFGIDDGGFDDVH